MADPTKPARLREAAAEVLRSRDKTALRDAIKHLDEAYRAALAEPPAPDLLAAVEAIRTMKVETRTPVDSAFNAGIESAATWLESRSAPASREAGLTGLQKQRLAAAALAAAAPAPDLLAAVEAQHHLVEGLNADGDDRAGCMCGDPECAVLALIESRDAPASREAGLDAERLREFLHERICDRRAIHDETLGRCADLAAEYARLAGAPVTEVPHG